MSFAILCMADSQWLRTGLAAYSPIVRRRNCIMTDRIGAPGTGISQREFLAASGSVGTAALAGCLSSGGQPSTNPTLGDPPADVSGDVNLPHTAPPEVVNVEELGDVPVREGHH
jgi:hypothetical protein